MFTSMNLSLSDQANKSPVMLSRLTRELRPQLFKRQESISRTRLMDHRLEHVHCIYNVPSDDCSMHSCGGTRLVSA